MGNKAEFMEYVRLRQERKAIDKEKGQKDADDFLCDCVYNKMYKKDKGKGIYRMSKVD